MIERGELFIHYESPLELELDVHFDRIIKLVEQEGIDCVVFDSCAVYEMTSPDEVADYLYALATFFKNRLATVFFNYESPELLGLSQISQELKGSHLVDNIILLNYVEISTVLRRAIAIPKVRGSHNLQVTREYVIADGGLQLLDEECRDADSAGAVPQLPFSSYYGLLSRSPSRQSPLIEDAIARGHQDARIGRPADRRREVITIARPHPAQVDWEEWHAPLDQFAQATGLTVSAYDAAGARMVGPLLSSRTARLLRTSTLWDDDGPGSELERRIAGVVAATGRAAPDEQFHGLRVCSLPLTQFGKVYGVLVFGWCFRDFSSPMACEQIGRLVEVSGQALWNEVRLEAPMSDARMATNAALLRTLAGSIDRQRETIEQLNRVNRTRDLFLATVSHEMRTPLAALSMRVELMLRTNPDLPPSIQSGLNSMRVHVRQEAAMVDDLIDAARTLTGQMSVERAAVPLGRIVRDAVSTIEVDAHEKGIAFSVAPADFGDAITIAGDARRLQQVLWNLLLNAIKFTPPAARSKSVSAPVPAR